MCLIYISYTCFIYCVCVCVYIYTHPYLIHWDAINGYRKGKAFLVPWKTSFKN